MDQATRAWKVTGWVQGVGFRWFVLRVADSVGLRGYARNLRNGSVEVGACGPSESLEVLAKALADGPRHARVDGVEEIPPPPGPRCLT